MDVYTIIGVTYVVISTVGVVANVMAAVMISVDKEMRDPTYILMINLSYADAICLLAIGTYAGLDLIIDIHCLWCDRIFGWLIAVGWYPSGYFFVMIAISRYVILCKSYLRDKIFSPRLLKVYMIIPWGFMPIFFSVIIWYSPALVPFFRELFTWGYDISHPVGAYFSYQNIIYNGTCALAQIGLNAFSLAWVHRTRKQIQNIDTANNRRREIRLFFQCLVTSTFYTLTSFMFFIFFILQDKLGHWHFLSLHMVWLLNHTVSPIIYFCMNKRLRRRLLRQGPDTSMAGFSKQVPVSAVSSNQVAPSAGPIQT